jgi:flagellar biosynthesis/type III secretory pathway chaperone
LPGTSSIWSISFLAEWSISEHASAERGSADAHDYLVERFGVLLELLLAERKALVQPGQSDLQTLVERKEALCRDIARHQSTLLAALAPTGFLPESMTELRSLAQRCRTENALNGRIAIRARNSVRTLLGVLTGDEPASVYHKPGSDRPAPGSPGHRLGSA